MRARTVVGLIVLAGCSTRGSVELVIQPNSPAVDRVALFVGVGDPTMQGIAPMGANGRFGVTSWDRDANNELSQVEGVAGKEVTFGLEGPADPLSIVIAVGFDAQQRPISGAVISSDLRPLVVPDRAIARYTLALEPLVSTDPTSHLDMRVWNADASSPGDKNACVIAQDKDAHENTAVVTPGDQDCDGWPTGDAKECVKTWFMATASPRLPDINCILSLTVAGPNGIATTASVLGGDTCVDGTGTVHGCSPSNYCLPRSVAEMCGTTGYPCAQDITSRNTLYTTVTHMLCPVAHDTNGKLCENALAGLPMPGPWLQNHTCKDGSIKITRPSQMWDTQVTAPTTGGTITTTLAQSDSTNCQFTLTPSGPGPTAETITWGALVAGDLDNDRGVAIPYVFSAAPTDVGCDSPQPCVAVFDSNVPDAIGPCVDSPAIEP